MSASPQVKSKQRVAAHGEVFTAEREVKAMCDLVADECNRIDSRFLEPACGDGNFLAEVLSRKLATCQKKYGMPLLRPEYERASVNAVMSVYGVELLPDNAQACRERLFTIWNQDYSRVCASAANEQCREVVKYIFAKNILCGDALTMKQADGTPIIFAEWSFIDGSLVKRRDFRLDQLINCDSENKKDQLSFNGLSGLEYDPEQHCYIPTPIREYPPIDYRRLCEHA